MLNSFQEIKYIMFAILSQLEFPWLYFDDRTNACIFAYL